MSERKTGILEPMSGYQFGSRIDRIETPAVIGGKGNPGFFSVFKSFVAAGDATRRIEGVTVQAAGGYSFNQLFEPIPAGAFFNPEQV